LLDDNSGPEAEPGLDNQLAVTMPSAHLYLFSDACPSDWLVDGRDETWHTVANFLFQSDPALQMQIDSGKSHEEVLKQDLLYSSIMTDLEAQLRFGRLQKWHSKGAYKTQFCQAFGATWAKYHPIVSACSFQQKTLRASKVALIRSYNNHIGGIEGRGIGFEEFKDTEGRLQMKHSFVNFNGYHEIRAPENQMLVLLLMAWFIADQYVFYRKEMVTSKRLGFERLGITIVSDKLSGDNELRQTNEQNLRNLIDPEAEGTPIVLTRSPQSDTFSGDLLVDNLAGWLNAAVSDPTEEFAHHAQKIAASGVWRGWHMLADSPDTLIMAPALTRHKA
jgi:hypothetical protein